MKAQVFKDGEIDLISLIKYLWAGRKVFYYSLIVCVIIGLLTASLATSKYTSTAKLLPSEQNNKNMGGIGALAGLAGINISSILGNAAEVPVDVYPEILKSYRFKNEFVKSKFLFEDFSEPISMYDFEVNDTLRSLKSVLKDYTIGLPRTIKKALKKEEVIGDSRILYDEVYITEDEDNIFRELDEILSLEVDLVSGLIKISAEAEERRLSAQYVQRAIDILKSIVIEYKTKKVKERLVFLEERYKNKEEDYIQARGLYYKYRDEHRGQVLERTSSEYDNLRDKYENASSLYKELSMQLEQAKIAVEEKTPSFSILQEGVVPIEKSSMSKKVVLAIWMFLGVFFGVFILLTRLYYFEVIKPRL